jgi:Flp pilus assembly protein TadG
MRLKQAGSAAVELALVLPLFLLSLDGIIEFSMVMYDKNIISNAAREAARAGLVLATPKMVSADISAVATSYCNAFLISFGDVNTLSVVVLQSTPPDYQTPLSVTVSYTYSNMLLGSSLSAMNIPIVLTSNSTQNNE